MRVEFKGKVWDKAAVHALLDQNPEAVARALMTIYERQTADEQVSEETRHRNGVGFTGRDANWLTDVAKKWQRYGRWASERQCNAVRKSIKKYWRQLLDEIAEKEGAVVLSGRRQPVSADCEVEEAPAGAWS